MIHVFAINHLFQTTPRISKRKKNKKNSEKKYKINIKQVQFEQFCETNILIVNLKSSFDVPKEFWHVSAIFPS